ncbi:MAG: sulfotransferase [Proteobacteria bacterium]|nr:sulfotransferase [Pseudomonadota bacterium]
MNAACAAIERRMVDEAAVFIAGCNRSGTTALRHTLDQHPAFRVQREMRGGGRVRSPETGVFVDPERVFAIRDPRGRRLLRYLLGNEGAAAEMLDALGPRQDWPRERWPELLRVFFSFAKRARGVRRVLEKTPRHVHHLDRLYAAFPRARVLLCMRHPVDVQSSLQKRRRERLAAGRPPAPGGWQALTRADFTGVYAEVSELVLDRARRDPERALLVRYEDLTRDPRTHLQRVCTFVGEPFDESVLLGGLAVDRDAEGSPRNRGRIVANEKNWEVYLEVEEASALEDSLAGPLRALGYERYTSAR